MKTLGILLAHFTVKLCAATPHCRKQTQNGIEDLAFVYLNSIDNIPIEEVIMVNILTLINTLYFDYKI